ncbi:MAG: SRPBCC family protein [Nocardioidaceae bacterium]
MELTHRFTVPASVDEAWETFNDLERIAPCFPGASLTSFEGDEFKGTCKVKLGPISLQYAGTGRFVERDEPTHHAVVEAKGKDKRGNGTANATITAQLTASGDSSTDVEVVTDLSVTGKPAQFGRGVMQDVGDKLLGQFAECLETKMGGAEDDSSGRHRGPAAEPEEAETGAAAAATTGAATGAGVADTAQAAESAPHDGSSVPSSAAPSSAASSGPQADVATETELDLGATVLPVLAKRYAPYAVGALLLALVLKKLRRRRRTKGSGPALGE